MFTQFCFHAFISHTATSVAILPQAQQPASCVACSVFGTHPPHPDLLCFSSLVARGANSSACASLWMIRSPKDASVYNFFAFPELQCRAHVLGFRNGLSKRLARIRTQAFALLARSAVAPPDKTVSLGSSCFLLQSFLF